MLHVASQKQRIIHNIHLCNIVISRSTHFTIYSYLPTVYRAVFLQVFVQIFQAGGIISDLLYKTYKVKLKRKKSLVVGLRTVIRTKFVSAKYMQGF